MNNQILHIAGLPPNVDLMTPDEVALLSAFRAIGSDARSDALHIMNALAEAHPCGRPALRLLRAHPNAPETRMNAAFDRSGDQVHARQKIEPRSPK